MKSMWEQFQDQLETEPDDWVIRDFETFKLWHDRCHKGAK